jgi:hypothetical protein
MGSRGFELESPVGHFRAGEQEVAQALQPCREISLEQMSGQPGPAPAAQGQRDGLQHLVQAAGPLSVAGSQARDLLGERHLRAPRVTAEEPADLQVD